MCIILVLDQTVSVSPRGLVVMHNLEFYLRTTESELAVY